MTSSTAADLVARSNRLGSDPKVTNYAGGNTSAKGTDIDPVTGEPVELLWVKGSGGDLGTLTEKGLAVLRLDRMRALVDVYPGIEREDEMVAAFDYCLHGKGGAAPSIDTAMHGLVDAAHVDHLHPDAGIAIATAADGEKLTTEIFGDKVVWVPWRRPGFQLGLDIAAIKEKNPQAIGTILGGHGITAWGDTSEEAERNSLWIIDTAQAHIDEHGAAEPFGGVRAGFETLPEAERRAKAAALAPTIRGLASTDKPMVGHYTDSAAVLDFLASEKAPALAALGTSCPDHFLRTKVKPLILDLPADASIGDAIARLQELHAEYREDYQAYYETHADAALRQAQGPVPAMRGADPLIVLVPGVGMFSYGANKQTARVAGEFYVNAINVMRGAEALSTYSPISDAEKFRIEYWALEEAKLQRMPKPKTHQGRIAFVTGAASGIGKAIATRLAAEGACVVVADLDLEKAQAAAAELGSADVAIGVAANVADAEAVQAAIDATVLAFGGIDLVVNNAGSRCRSRCWRPPRRTGTCSTTSWRRARSSWRRPRPRPDRAEDGGRCHLHLVEELGVRRPQQHRLLGDQGRPGPPGAPAGRRAGRARRARERHQPRRRRARLGHLRCGLGRQPRRHVRRRREGPRAVLRQPHDPQARGRARERRRCGVRAHRSRALAHDGPAHPRRLRRRRGVPAMSDSGSGAARAQPSRPRPGSALARGRSAPSRPSTSARPAAA